ncbi:MAG: glycosyltransferase family 4 protein [Clostridiales bacterium]|nr:glycosyltransferase family 4 protein [Clostridiales bacterium]
MEKLKVGIFNDSFPPVIDGVSQVLVNYGKILTEKGCKVTVVTPRYKGAVYNYPYEVMTYTSFNPGERIGYRVGIPFGPKKIAEARNKNFDIMHIHAPLASSVMVRNVNRKSGVPVVLTYHSKYDIDFLERMDNKLIQNVAVKFVRSNLYAADEIWAVSSGCGESLRRMGYNGDFRVMENGTDFPFGKVSENVSGALREKYSIADDETVFLYVGRLMWYKNVRLITDALKICRDRGLKFRFIMVGGGYDAEAIKARFNQLGLEKNVIYTGLIRDREYLRAFYSIADVFLFPSTYDTSGIVVKEAAACGCPSVMVRDSCASEGAVDGVNAYLIREEAEDFARVLLGAASDREKNILVGEQAAKTLYLPWEVAVDRAYTRYLEILK